MSNSSVGKCTCAKFFDYASEKDMKVKRQMQCKFCPSPPEGSKQVKATNKVMTMKEFYNDEAKMEEDSSQVPLAIFIPAG